MKAKEIINILESWAPLSFQENYDNSGLILGDPETEIKGLMISLDATLAVIAEAVNNQCNMIISHHPLIFKGIKNITPEQHSYAVIKNALDQNVLIYALHTNLDNHGEGLNHYLGTKLGLKDIRVLSPKRDLLNKLVTFCPVDYAEKVRDALFKSGAGHIGNYDCCSFNVSGHGTFRASEKATPFVGKKNSFHTEKEIRMEVIFPSYIETQIIRTLMEVHPYEEVAYDIYRLANAYPKAGAGIIGMLPTKVDEMELLSRIKKIIKIPVVRHSIIHARQVIHVALCSGAGAMLLPDVISSGGEVFLTSDLKYHEFQSCPNSLLLVDIGHYESECWMRELVRDFLIKKIPNFAVLISASEINPVNYL